jgi:protein-S-isoprenylcysteine O-methyltransferase Ste14
MYVGVIAVIAGQALLFGNLRVLEYAAVVGAGLCVFVMGYEEPKLRRTFGDEYFEFCRNVPRWVPRLTAWQGNIAKD